MKSEPRLLGDAHFKRASFSDLDAVFKQFQAKEFKELIDRRKSEWVNRVLLELIQKEQEPCFLLPAVLEYAARVDAEGLVSDYTFASFEFWLNQFSRLSFEENCRVRGKIAGKWIDRGEYQVLFPIGMGKIYPGTHFVTAHKSPDLDTTVASFWGWLDAFAARVGNGLHVWNLPGGPPGSQIEIELIFREMFGSAVFSHLPKTRTALAVTGKDLATQQGFQRKTVSDSLASVDREGEQGAIAIVDSDGFYLGDWLDADMESVRHVLNALSSCLRWFENELHVKLVSFFSQGEPSDAGIAPFFRGLFEMKVAECEPALEFTSAQRRETERFLKELLGCSHGLASTFEELGQSLAKLCKATFLSGKDLISSMKKAGLFDRSGRLVEDRPNMFHYLEKTVQALHASIQKIRQRLEHFDLALSMKHLVLEKSSSFATVRAEVEEMRNKIGSHPFLTIAYPDQGRFYPVGMVTAAELRKTSLGTVSLRDFSNREEMTIPPYLEVISIVDHHKSTLSTSSPALAVIGDAQSSNTLVAQLAFELNDRYALSGMSKESIEKQLAAIHGSDHSLSASRLARRLLQRRIASERKGSHFVHPDREFAEYLHFLYAILDDTDLLTKVTVLDVEVAASLLNRLKSIVCKQEMEIVHFDDLPRDKHFAKKAAERLLRTEDLYSLYRKVYQYREKEVDQNISLCAARKPSNFFADTKEQNGCCRVGQTKIFASNVASFESKADEIRRIWVEMAKKAHKDNREINLHLHMISTVVSAEEVYGTGPKRYSHRDELWIWHAPDEAGVEHLKSFLSAFQNSPGLQSNMPQVEFLGPNAAELSQIFRESFLASELKTAPKPDPSLPIAILRYKPGSLNSRKAMISPFLPTR